MSVGFVLTGFGSPEVEEQCLDWLAAYSENEEDVRFEEGAGEAFLMLHPTAEPLVFSFPDRGQVVISTTTSSTGPGYHLAACDLVLQLGEDLGIEWDEPGEHCSDEGGYFHTGDRDAPARAMRAWLQNVCAEIREKTATHVMIGLPPDQIFLAPGRTLTPMGPRDEAWLAAPGDDFFAWLEPEKDAEYHRRAGESMLWTAIPWRPPVDDNERALYQQALGHFEKAGGGPQAEIEEMRALLADEPPTAPGTIGYRRHPILHFVRAPWTIKLPGGLVVAAADADEWAATDGETSVHLRCFDLEGRSAAQILEDTFHRQRDETLEQGPHARRAALEEDTLHGLVAIDGALCVATITGVDQDAMVAIWDSLEARVL